MLSKIHLLIEAYVPPSKLFLGALQNSVHATALAEIPCLTALLLLYQHRTIVNIMTLKWYWDVQAFYFYVGKLVPVR